MKELLSNKAYFNWLLSFIMLIIISNPPKACTVFNSDDGKNVLFGNVENEAPHYITELHFKPPDESQGNYGNFYCYYNGNIAGGMNDKGLCFDVAALPSHIAITGKPYNDLMSYLLNKCSTLHEALDFFQSFAWYGHSVNHIMIMDSTGASAIVEVIGSTLYIFWKESYKRSQVMTNYSIADPEIRYGDYPCNRYLDATSILDTMSLTLDNMQKVCYKVRYAYHNALYANIYNPKSLEIHVLNANIIGQRTTFSLLEEFNKGEHHYILRNNHIYLNTNDISARNSYISNNYPNPFSQVTNFDIDLTTDADVIINILDIYNNNIDEIENSHHSPGKHSFLWNSDKFANGIYFCRINIDGVIETRKWIKK